VVGTCGYVTIYLFALRPTGRNRNVNDFLVVEIWARLLLLYELSSDRYSLLKMDLIDC
jgi:hypothetical protein